MRSWKALLTRPPLTRLTRRPTTVQANSHTPEPEDCSVLYTD